MHAAAIDEAYWRGVIRRGEATFFVGAGVSAPSLTATSVKWLDYPALSWSKFGGGSL